jgi:hypothetical protein
MEELTKVSHKLAEEIYKAASAKQQSQQGQAGPGAGEQNAGEGPKQPDKKEEDIIDAEYKEEDQDGKK